MKTAVVYWSGTGNTEAMAGFVADGLREKGAECTVYPAADFNPSQLAELDAVAFGCPSMGAEELEETEFAPMFDLCDISGKRIVLFGSYGWGDGEWMRTWEGTCRERGAVLAADSVICNEAPDDDAAAACKTLGAALVG